MKYTILVLLFAVGMFTAQGQNPDYMPTKSKSEAYSALEMLTSYDQFISENVISDNKGWKAYARWMEFTRERLNPGGVMADHGIFLDEAVKIAEEKKDKAALKSGLAWSPVGPFDMPGTYSSSPSYGMGRINCITFHPTDPNIYWIGVAQGGVWKTSNGGENYTPLTDNMPILRISDIAVDKQDPDIMYISACDYAYIGVALNTDGRKRHSHYGLGVYKTTDGGVNWEPTGLTFNQAELDVTLIRKVVISPDNSNTLLAAGVSGIYKSTDAGISWNILRNDLIWDFEQDLTDGNVIYASTGYVRTLGRGQASLLKSTDFGETWTSLHPDFPGDQSISRVEIGLTSETQDYVYLIASDINGGFYGFYRSTDGGASWQTRMDYTSGINILAWSTVGSGSGGQGWYDLAIMVDPKDKEKVYIGGINMWGSENGGTTWSPCSYWVMSNGFTLHADHHQYKYNPVDQKYYACQDGGVARTSEIILGADGTGKWNTKWEERSNGMSITSFYRLGLAEMFPGYVIAGAQDNSTFYNQNGDWVNIIGGDGMEAMIHPDNPQIIYGSSQYGSWSRSRDGGRSFRGIRPTYQENGGWTTPMVMNPNNPDEIYTGYGNVWKSTNQGDDWQKISDFPIISGYGKPAVISALSISPTDPKHIYIGKRAALGYTTTSSFWATHDGTNWGNVTDGLPDALYFSYIAVDNDDPMSVWVTCSGFLEGHKVFHSSDGGANWANVSWDLPNIPVNTIIHQNGSDKNIIYIGTDAGIYYSWDGWDHWELHSTDLPNVVVSELEIHYPSRKIYAATFGRGIWMADLASPISSIEIDNSTSSRLDVFPNPSKGAFTVSFTGLPAGEFLIEIVDIQGREVYSSVPAYSDGTTQTVLEPKLNPGVYFVRVWLGQTLRTTRVLIN
ncbi:MAG: T9SS type A sorting domain-containing protein [Bacteroidales bacterium]|nr:T9SS type A sorting domain-containing protein [Bacteroidales bacterium]